MYFPGSVSVQERPMQIEDLQSNAMIRLTARCACHHVTVASNDRLDDQARVTAPAHLLACRYDCLV